MDWYFSGYLNQCAKTCLYMCYRLLKLMAPSRKSRSVNKRFSTANEASSSKYVEDASKSKQKVCVWWKLTFTRFVQSVEFPFASI